MGSDAMLSIVLILALVALGCGPKTNKKAEVEQGAPIESAHDLAIRSNAGAQYLLGLEYENGIGVAKDYKQAATWFRKAAEQGNVLSQFELGLMYEFGDGVGRDSTTAVMWYNLAAGKGDENARAYRDHLKKTMTPAQIATAERLTQEWRPRHDYSPFGMPLHLVLNRMRA